MPKLPFVDIDNPAKTLGKMTEDQKRNGIIALQKSIDRNTKQNKKKKTTDSFIVKGKNDDTL